MEEKQNSTPTPYQEIANPITDKNVKQNTNKLREMARHGRLDFWAEMSKNISWFEEWETILDDSNAPFYKWFNDGRINASYNCVDRHINGWRKNKAAIIFEGDRGDTRVLTY